MEKLQYPRNYYQALKAFCENKEFKNIEINFQFLDFHNHTCPRCRIEMKKSKNEVKNVGGYGLSVFKTKNIGIPYMICKSCSNKINKEPDFLRKKNAEELDNYIQKILSF